MALSRDPPRGALTPPAEASEQLLVRAAAGDAEALLVLYDRLAPTLMAVALRITGMRATAEDVLQEAMTRAWREAPSYDPQRGTAVAWLVTLTRNCAIDALRVQRRHAERQSSEALPTAPSTSTPELEVSVAERAAAVRQALAQLGPEHRAVLELAYYAGLSHAEIAARLGQPLGTVKSRIAQAARRLRDALACFAPDAAREPAPVHTEHESDRPRRS